MRFQQQQAIPIFPTLIWAHDLPPEEAGPLNDRLAAAIETLIAPRPAILPGQTWQTHQDLHLRPEFKGLVDLIHQAARGVLDYLKVDVDGIEITGCWANVNPTGSPHSLHTHPNNYLSGVYYVRTPPGADAIRFVDPRTQARQIAPKVRERNAVNSMDAFVNVPPGRLVLFPAWLQHSVPANSSGQERISIAFNLMYTDFTQRYARPKWEGIKPRDSQDT
jgi:uncharacterized protein (TIGR02466 family)